MHRTSFRYCRGVLPLLSAFIIVFCLGGCVRGVNDNSDSGSQPPPRQNDYNAAETRPYGEKEPETAYVEERPSVDLAVEVSAGNIRSKPSTKSSIIAVTKRGDVLSLIEERGNWKFVRLPDGRTGWAHKILFVEKAPPAMSSGGTQPPKIEAVRKTPKPKPEPEPRAEVRVETRDETDGIETPKTQADTTWSRQDEPKEAAAAAMTEEPAVEEVESVPEPKTEEDVSEPPSEEIKADAAREGETAPAASAEKKYLVISDCEKADVFGKPNVFAPKTGSLSVGEKIEYVEMANSFYEIVHNGKTGYVYKDFCKVLD